jgi:hypothetical protein
MVPSVILPETVTGQDGVGAAVPVEPGAAFLLLTLSVTRVLEYESLELAIAGSPDGTTWRELARFPPQCYCGDCTIRMDLSRLGDIKYLRAEWKLTRWAASGAPPLFEFSVRAAGAATAGS